MISIDKIIRVLALFDKDDIQYIDLTNYMNTPVVSNEKSENNQKTKKIGEKNDRNRKR